MNTIELTANELHGKLCKKAVPLHAMKALGGEEV
jgi:hypothetical protein